MTDKRAPAVSRRQAAGIVLVRNVGEWRFLILRAYRNWDFPKGEVGIDEDVLDAAFREVAEETSLRRDEIGFPWGERFIETEPYSGGKVARYYLGLAHREEIRLLVNPVLGRAEHHEYRWAPYDDAQSLLVPRLQRVLRWAMEIVAHAG